LIENHLDHSQDCKGVINENIAEFFKRHQGILMSVNARIIELNDEITSFLDHAKLFTSAQFLQFVSILKKFDIFSSHLGQEEEQK
jgi:hypothetical protein